MRYAMTAAALAATAFLSMPHRAKAQLTGNAPWCVTIYTSSNQINRCEYTSFEQCQALNDGRNNTCFANPYVQTPPSPAQRRR